MLKACWRGRKAVVCTRVCLHAVAHALRHGSARAWVMRGINQRKNHQFTLTTRFVSACALSALDSSWWRDLGRQLPVAQLRQLGGTVLAVQWRSPASPVVQSQPTAPGGAAPTARWRGPGSPMAQPRQPGGAVPAARWRGRRTGIPPEGRCSSRTASALLPDTLQKVDAALGRPPDDEVGAWWRPRRCSTACLLASVVPAKTS